MDKQGYQQGWKQGCKRGCKQGCKQGFTLIEFLITIALIGIISSFFIPRLTGFSKRQTLKTVSEDVVTHIESARNKALSGVQGGSDPAVAYGVFYSSIAHATGIYRQVDRGTYEEWEATAVEQLSFPSEIEITWPLDPVFVVPTGKYLGSDITITVCYDDIGKHEVAVFATGVINMGQRLAVGSCP